MKPLVNKSVTTSNPVGSPAVASHPLLFPRFFFSGFVVVSLLSTLFITGTAFAAIEDTTLEGKELTNWSATEDSWSMLDSRPETDTLLGFDSGAATRAKLRDTLEVSSCMEESLSGAADGIRQITVLDEVYFPLNEGSYRLTSSYGYRIHPTLGIWKLHEGDDFSAPMGSPIRSVADGVVTKVAGDSGSGDYVVIKHEMPDGTYYSRYLHQYRSQIVVSEGQVVSAGEVIGAVGSNGRSTGPHLHLEILNSNKTTIAPRPWLEAQGSKFWNGSC